MGPRVGKPGVVTVDLDLKVGLASLGLAQAGVGEVKNLGLRLEGVGAVALNASSEKRHLVILRYELLL